MMRMIWKRVGARKRRLQLPPALLILLGVAAVLCVWWALLGAVLHA